MGATLVVDWCSWQSGLDQLDSPTVDHLEVRRGRDGHGPAEVMTDAKSHTANVATLWMDICGRELFDDRPVGRSRTEANRSEGWDATRI